MHSDYLTTALSCPSTLWKYIGEMASLPGSGVWGIFSFHWGINDDLAEQQESQGAYHEPGGNGEGLNYELVPIDDGQLFSAELGFGPSCGIHYRPGRPAFRDLLACGLR